MKRVWLGSGFFAWIFVLSVLFAAGLPVGDAHASSISGRVVDSVTSVGIDGVMVMAQMGAAAGFIQTDVNGNFSISTLADFSPLPDGTYSVSFMKDGYVQLAGLTAISVVVSGNTSMGQISLTPTSAAGHSVSGKVIDGNTFSALGGVTVTVTDGSGNTEGSNATDASGNFSISLPADGLYYLTLVKGGYSSITGSNAWPAFVTGDYDVGIIPMMPATKLDLTQGWNFISLPKFPDSTAVADVLSDVSPDLAVIWSYDNETKQWLKYRPSGTNNTLVSLRPGLGYWVYLQRAGSLDTSWWLPLGTHSMHVYRGWNLLGYNGTDNVGLATGLQSISGKWSILWTWESKWYAKSPSIAGLPVDPITGLNLGKAYWVKGSAEAKWLQPTDASGSVWAIGSTPTDNTSGLTPSTSVQVQMWNDIDPSSVTKNSVALYGKGEFGVSRSAGLAVYDDVKNTITFRPQGGGLQLGTDFTLTLKGGAIKDTPGNSMFDDYEVTFSTVRNQLKKYIDYKADKTVKEYGIYEFDGDGNVTRHIHYEGAGADLTWFTVDDDVSYYETYAMPDFMGGGYGRKTRYEGPGFDGIWFTADDRGFGPDPDYNITGPLGIQIKTNDPPFSSNHSRDVLKGNRITQSSFGAFQVDYSYNAGGYLTRVDYGNFSAADMDRYSFYETEEYNGDDFPVKTTKYGGPGLDATWFTEDDEVMSYSLKSYSTNGVLVQTVRYVSPGPNTIWFDGDDAASSCTKYVYGGDNLVARTESYLDITSSGVPCTGTLYEYTQYTYDSQGRKTGAIRYLGPGLDGVWFTADDVPMTAYEYDTTW